MWSGCSRWCVVGPVAGLQSPDLTSSTRVPQPVSRTSPQHVHSHAQSVRVPGAVTQHAADTDAGLSVHCIIVFLRFTK